MYESSRVQNVPPGQYDESRSRHLGSSIDDSPFRTSIPKRKIPVVEIISSSSASADTSRSQQSFDSTPRKTGIYANNTPKRLFPCSQEGHACETTKRRKEDASSTLNVDSPLRCTFSARLGGSQVYDFSKRNMPGSKDALPKVIRQQLERWYTRYGRTLPPCASFSHIQSSRSDDTSEWTHVPSGERLKVTVYTMNKENDPRPSQGHPKRLIWAQGRTQGPFLIQYFGNDGGVSRFRIWRGVDSGSAEFAGDRNGFEHRPSVTKKPFYKGSSVDLDASNDDDEDPISAEVPRSRQIIVKPQFMSQLQRRSPKLREGHQNSRINDQNALHAVRTSIERVEKSPSCDGGLKRLKNFEDSHSGEPRPSRQGNRLDQVQHNSFLLRISGAGPTQESLPSCAHSDKLLVATPPRQEQLNSLFRYIRENCEFWFMPLHEEYLPRIRPYHTCDKAKTLFGHARSARVFDPSPNIANVLTIRICDDSEAMTLMEEDDPKFREQDYEAFLASLRDAACWIWLDGQWTGNCNIEVKAMQ